MNHTLQGAGLLDRFVKVVCGCKALWTPSNIVDDIITQVREQVGSSKVILGLSGGVDSSVVAALLARAIGDQLTCVFVDNGLLRRDESAQVNAMMGQGTENTFALNMITVAAEDKFLTRLAGVTDPEDEAEGHWQHVHRYFR